METISKPSQILAKPSEQRFYEGFLKLNIRNEDFQSFSETKGFEDIPNVGTFVSNDGSSTMIRPCLHRSIPQWKRVVLE